MNNKKRIVDLGTFFGYRIQLIADETMDAETERKVVSAYEEKMKPRLKSDSDLRREVEAKLLKDLEADDTFTPPMFSYPNRRY